MSDRKTTSPSRWGQPPPIPGRGCPHLLKEGLERTFSKWLIFAFLCFVLGVAAAPLLTGFPNGGSILPEAGTVVQTPELCASMAMCHVAQSTLNEVGGVEFENLPESYEPGAVYDLTLRITGNQRTQVYGFQLAAFFLETTTQAGSLTAVSAGVQSIDFAGFQVLTHIDPLPSGEVAFRWTAPATAAGPVILRVASNSANGNFASTGDHINSRDALIPPAEAATDTDGDGVDDGVEDGAANNGDGNGDGIADREQPNVASLPDHTGGAYVTLATTAPAIFSEVVSMGNPFPDDVPLGVDFPVGFFAYRVRNLSPGASAEVRFILADGNAANTFFKFGPTPQNPSARWYDFLFDGQTGVQFGEGEIILHLTDGARGDDDLAANGEIVDPAAPAFQREVFYFPQIGLGQFGELTFTTDLVFVNTGEKTRLDIELFDSSGQPLAAPIEIDGAIEGPASNMSRELEIGEALNIRLADEGPIRAGYARITAKTGVGGTAVFTQTNGSSQTILSQAGVPAASALTDFSLAANFIPNQLDTGLALVNASRGPGDTEGQGQAAKVTLRLYDRFFNEVAVAQVPLPAGQHLPRFLTQFFPELAETAGSFFGAVTVESDQPLAAVTLLQLQTAAITAFPVVPGRADR